MIVRESAWNWHLFMSFVNDGEWNWYYQKERCGGECNWQNVKYSQKK